MSLDKAIFFGKERRRPFKGGKVVDSTCRNHGSCDWCRGDRLHVSRKDTLRADELLDEGLEDLANKGV